MVEKPTFNVGFFISVIFNEHYFVLHHDVEKTTIDINNNTKLLIFSIIRHKNWFKMRHSRNCDTANKKVMI